MVLLSILNVYIKLICFGIKSKVSLLLSYYLNGLEIRPALPVTSTPQSGKSNDDITLQSCRNNDPIPSQLSGSYDAISSGSIDQELQLNHRFLNFTSILQLVTHSCFAHPRG